MEKIIKLYDDDEDFCVLVKTNCDIKLFQKYLNSYRNLKSSKEFGYNIDDFKDYIIRKGYYFIQIKPDETIFF